MQLYQQDMMQGNGGKIRINSITDMANLLEKAGSGLDFKAYPIAGEPETFHYDQSQQSVTRTKDGQLFDNIEDFICYCFQCDPEGYSHTEHIDVEILDRIKAPGL